MIVFINKVRIMFVRYLIDQNGSCNDKIRIKFIIINNGSGIEELNIAGSNEEKISDIIFNDQNMVLDHLGL
jgi:hypothetical protein